MSETWLKFLEGKIDAKAVLDKYKEQGFDANQDIPGNMLWEELYAASPKGQKVSFEGHQRSLKVMKLFRLF